MSFLEHTSSLMWRPYGVYQEVCARAQTRADQNSSTSSCHWLTSTPNYIFWLRFWQIDVARLWNLACLRPSWQYWKQVYNLPALESSDGLTNAQYTLSLVFVFCCVLNHSAFMNIVETILNIIYVCLHNSLMLHSCLVLPSWYFPNAPVLAQSRLWQMLSNWGQWYLNLDHLPNGWVCFCHRALEYKYIIIDV